MTTTILNHTKANLKVLCEFFKDILEICIAEKVTTLGTAIIEIFEDQISNMSMDDYLTRLVSRSYDPKTDTFSIWDKIHSKDEEHFKENIVSLVDEKYKDNLYPYVCLLDEVDGDGELIINEEYKEVTWEYAYSFVIFAIKYVHLSKEPCMKEENGFLVETYKNNRFAEIDNKELDRMAKLYGIKLEW